MWFEHELLQGFGNGLFGDHLAATVEANVLSGMHRALLPGGGVLAQYLKVCQSLHELLVSAFELRFCAQCLPHSRGPVVTKFLKVKDRRD